MKLMVIDGNSIINRAFYGIRMLTTKSGMYTNAVYGFLSILQKLLAEENPDGLCVAFDLKGPTFRHQQYELYKAQRKGMPDELAAQMPLLKEVLDAMNVPHYGLEGYEADDLIGTIAAVCDRTGWDCAIVTGDKDDLQLVTERVYVKLVTTRSGTTTTVDYTPEVFQEKYGFPPRKLIDLKALMGDSSDNIPGVPGVGEKTAMELIGRYGSLDAIYADLDTLDIKPGVRKKLEAGQESARMSYDLATIRCDVPFPFLPEETVRKAPDEQALRELFVKLEFTSFMDKFGLTSPAGAERKPVSSALSQIQSADEAEALLARCRKAEYVAVRVLDNLDGVEIGEAEGISVVMHGTLGEGYTPFLQALFGGDIAKVGHDIKDTMRDLCQARIKAEGYVFDTALAAYLISPTDNAYGLDKLSAQYLGAQEDEAVSLIFRLYPLLAQRLEQLGLRSLFDDVELPLCDVLAEMEHTGFLVDRTALQQFSELLTTLVADAQREIYALAGEEFNINSPKQLGVILFDKLGLPAQKKTKTGYSTNAEVLERLKDKHEIIQKILDFREYAKLKSTYADGLTKAIAEDGRIHTNFQMTVTATGRLSSTEPNLQNIPVRKELGGEIRKMFVAGPGNVLVDADYSQIELRLLAHISGDETMIGGFLSGEDVHTVTASQVFDVPKSEVTPLMRSRAKAVNFGIVYGISAFSLSADIGVSQAEAKAYMDNYLSKYHGVRDYMSAIVQAAKAAGQVETLFGRIRPLPELQSSNFNMRSFGERVALNMPIQGTAADIIKLAMVHVHRRLEAEGLAARLVLQVHDELIVEAPEAEAERVKTLLTEEMERVMSLSVPLIAEAHTGRTWYDAK